jgi:uncharacterized membrane protein YfcA
MPDFWFSAALITIGVFTGTLTGLTGGSGMSFLISGLLLLGVDIRNIIALTFVVTFVNSLAALPAYLKAGNLHIATAMCISIPAALCVIPGHLLSQHIKGVHLAWVIMVSLFLLGMKMTFGRDTTGQQDASTRSGSWLLLGLFGSVIGFLVGVFGGGGGVFIGVLLILLFHVPVKEAVGISLLVMAVSAVSGIAMNASSGRLELSHTLLIAVPSVLFAVFSSSFGNRVKERVIRLLLGVYLLAMSLGLIAKKIVENAGV